MDFHKAVRAHSDWLLKLTGYCRGTLKEHIDTATLGVDNRCELGQWLHANIQHYANDPLYKQLVKAHAEFHKQAAGVAQLIEQGQKSKALAALESGTSPLHDASHEVTRLLVMLNRKYETQRA